MKLYQVTTKHFVAGYVEDEEGNLINCAPILLKRFSYWKTRSKLIKEIQMAKQYEITKIEYNQKIKDKYPCAFLYTKGVESDAKRKDPVFENSKQFKVLQECAVGNIVELKIVKSGDYFNLAKDDDAIVLISKDKSVESEIHETGPNKPTKHPIISYSGYKEDPEKQAAIIRQNALTNATNLIIAAKASGDMRGIDTVKTIITIAIQFAKYASGEDMTEYLMEEEPPFEPDKLKRGRKPTPHLDAVPQTDPTERGEFGE